VCTLGRSLGNSRIGRQVGRYGRYGRYGRVDGGLGKKSGLQVIQNLQTGRELSLE